jgi:hypothetical protein
MDETCLSRDEKENKKKCREWKSSPKQRGNYPQGQLRKYMREYNSSVCKLQIYKDPKAGLGIKYGYSHIRELQYESELK